jgi:hypothetical protein
LSDKPVLNEIECEILIDLLFSPDCKVGCREIADLNYIGASTWNKEKKLLIATGLIEIESKKRV